MLAPKGSRFTLSSPEDDKMITDTLKKIFGTRNDRELKRIRKMVTRINRLEEEFQALDDQALRAKTDEFRSRLTAGRISMNCYPRRLRRFAKRASGHWVCGILMCS